MIIHNLAIILHEAKETNVCSSMWNSYVSLNNMSAELRSMIKLKLWDAWNYLVIVFHVLVTARVRFPNCIGVKKILYSRETAAKFR